MEAFARGVWQGLAISRMLLSPPAFFAQLAGLPWYGGMLREWTDALPLNPDAKVLEVGCSAGNLSRELARRGIRAFGVDRSARAIRLARRLSRQHPAPPRFEVADALDLPYDDSQFDAVIAASLLNIVPEPVDLLAEMLRVTGRGGIVSCLYPTPVMRPDRAHELVQAGGYRGFSGATLALWASRARLLETQTVAGWMEGAGVTEIHDQFFLEGMVCASTGRKS